MTQPIIIESRRLLDLIIEIRLFIPGIVPDRGDYWLSENKNIGRRCSLITPIIRVLITASDDRCLPNSARVSYAWLFENTIQHM